MFNRLASIEFSDKNDLLSFAAFLPAECVVGVFQKPHLMEQPDRVDPAFDFVWFRGWVF